MVVSQYGLALSIVSISPWENQGRGNGYTNNHKRGSNWHGQEKEDAWLIKRRLWWWRWWLCCFPVIASIPIITLLVIINARICPHVWLFVCVNVFCLVIALVCIRVSLLRWLHSWYGVLSSSWWWWWWVWTGPLSIESTPLIWIEVRFCARLPARLDRGDFLMNYGPRYMNSRVERRKRIDI